MDLEDKINHEIRESISNYIINLGDKKVSNIINEHANDFIKEHKFPYLDDYSNVFNDYLDCLELDEIKFLTIDSIYSDVLIDLKLVDEDNDIYEQVKTDIDNLYYMLF